MFKLYSILTSLIYTIFDLPPLHYLYGLIDYSSGYFVDYVVTKGTLSVFKRLKKAVTVFKRQ